MGIVLRPLIENTIESPGWNDLGGTAAIDAYNALYQFLSGIRQADGTPLMDAEGHITSHLSGILFRSANLIEKNINPIYIFDGKPPKFKIKTLEERKEVREHARVEYERAKEEGDEEAAHKYAMATSKVDAYVTDTAKELLTALGIAWVQAPSEGEAQASYMSQVGDVSFAVSQDYDSLLFGAENLVRNITISGKRRIHGKIITVTPERIYLSKVLETLGVTREGLIQIALLVGTDYNSGVSGIGPKKAIKIVKEGKFEENIVNSENSADPQVLCDYFLHPEITKDYNLKSGSANPDKVREILCEIHGFTEERVNAGLDRIGAKKGQATLDSWF